VLSAAKKKKVNGLLRYKNVVRYFQLRKITFTSKMQLAITISPYYELQYARNDNEKPKK
jgi:hypothetical protein